MNAPSYSGHPATVNNNNESNDGVVILFTKANGDGDGENSDCIERTIIGFFKSFRIVVLMLELYYGAYGDNVDFGCK